VEVSGRKLWYKVLGNDFKDAMRTYSTALLEFDRFVATYRNEAPVRDAALAIVSSEYGEEAMLQLARGDVDENLDFALQDLASKIEEDVKPEVVSAIYSGVLPEAPLSIAECLDRHFTYWKSGVEDKDRLLRNLGERAKTNLVEALGRQAVYETPVETLTRKDSNRYRDLLLSKMKPSSVKRLMASFILRRPTCLRNKQLPRNQLTASPHQTRGFVVEGSIFQIKIHENIHQPHRVFKRDSCRPLSQALQQPEAKRLGTLLAT
jgi:hypothetical protein